MNIRNDPAVNSFLQRMPKKIQETFTDEQLTHLKLAIGARHWGKHAIDSRGVIKFFKYRYYFVFLAGRNRRELSSSKKVMVGFSQVIGLFFTSLFTLLIILLTLYLVKSALGIDIFKNYSFGIWNWLKGSL